MADDRMRNDDLDRNMGGAGQKDNYGSQSPGRKQQQDDMSTGQRGASQKGEPEHFEDDFGTSEKSGAGQQGGQGGRQGQNR